MIDDHNEIWLEPKCPTCGEPEERLWCQDNVWYGDYCDGCGKKLKSVKYVRVLDG